MPNARRIKYSRRSVLVVHMLPANGKLPKRLADQRKTFRIKIKSA